MSRAFHERPLVYMAGPYALPDPVRNTHLAIKEADELQASGLVVCYVPHLTLLWHLVVPHGDTEDQNHWYEYDLVMLARSDALYRRLGESTGADAEVRFAQERQLPVFSDTDEVLAWAKGYKATP